MPGAPFLPRSLRQGWETPEPPTSTLNNLHPYRVPHPCRALCGMGGNHKTPNLSPRQPQPPSTSTTPGPRPTGAPLRERAAAACNAAPFIASFAMSRCAMSGRWGRFHPATTDPARKLPPALHPIHSLYVTLFPSRILSLRDGVPPRPTRSQTEVERKSGLVATQYTFRHIFVGKKNNIPPPRGGNLCNSKKTNTPVSIYTYENK